MATSVGNETVFALMTSGRPRRKEDFILERCRGLRVLDVGCVGQARGATSVAWLHGQLREVAKELHGVDIQREAVAALRAQGFEAFLPDELHERRYDRIVMGDVIEHVDNPTEFLRNYARHLAKGGRIVVTTPNAYSAAQTIGIVVSQKASVNAEHTCWFDPITFTEVASRAGLRVEEAAWLRNDQPGASWKSQVVLGASRVVQRLRPLLNDYFAVSLAASAE